MSGFPECYYGDTRVIITEDITYTMHSRHLTAASPVLRDLLGPPSRSRAELRYMLVLQDHSTNQGTPVLPRFRFRRIDLDRHGEAVHEPILLRECEDVDVDLYKPYHMLLAAICGRDPGLKQKESLSLAVMHDTAKKLVAIAEYLQCVCVMPHIQGALLSKGQELFRAMSARPIEWLDLSARIRCKPMFKEALVHCTGRYNDLATQAPEEEVLEEWPRARSVLDGLEPELREVVERKHTEMEAMCREVEARMVSFYPAHLQRQMGTGRADRDDIGKASYAADVFCWMALNLFRHWVGQEIATHGTHLAIDGGHRFFHRISLGGIHYLNRETVQGFHSLFPMSTKARATVEDNLNEIKVEMQGVVKPLFATECRLDLKRSPVEHLVCARVRDSDIPWERRPALPEGRVSEQASTSRNGGAADAAVGSG